MGDLVEFLRARLDEDEAGARAAATYSAEWYAVDDFNETVLLAADDEMGHTFDSVFGQVAPHIARHDPARVLAEVEAKRRIIDWHENWPVLCDRPPEIEKLASDDLTSMTFRMTQQISWVTEREYRDKFGSEPPTSPILLLLALPYANHSDYQEKWSI